MEILTECGWTCSSRSGGPAGLPMRAYFGENRTAGLYITCPVEIKVNCCEELA